MRRCRGRLIEKTAAPVGSPLEAGLQTLSIDVPDRGDFRAVVKHSLQADRLAFYDNLDWSGSSVIPNNSQALRVHSPSRRNVIVDRQSLLPPWGSLCRNYSPPLAADSSWRISERLISVPVSVTLSEV